MTPDRRVSIIGLGYVGLPLAIAFAEAGLEVEGVDASPARVAELNAGHSPIDDVSDERLAAALDGGLRVVAPGDARPGDVDALFVCVPTPITSTKDPDLGPVLAAAAFVRDGLRAGHLVVLQSTTFPGTTSGPFREVIEAVGAQRRHGLRPRLRPRAGEPRRPGQLRARRPAAGRRHDRGGHASAPRPCSAHVNDRVVSMSSPDAAEMAKLLENTFRNVNIAFVNQLALLCERMGLDVWEIIDAAATKPFGFMRFTPGPGVGGHCIPVDPYYLAWRAREFDFTERFIELAGDINFGMPRHVVDLVAEALNDRGKALKGARVGVLGVAFKPDVQDARNSPAGAILPGIVARGAELRYHDPLIPRFRDDTGYVHEGVGLDSLLHWADVFVVVTAHKAIDWDHFYAGAPLVVDTVNSSRGHAVRERQVLRLGAGWSMG